MQLLRLLVLLVVSFALVVSCCSSMMKSWSRKMMLSFHATTGKLIKVGIRGEMVKRISPAGRMSNVCTQHTEYQEENTDMHA